MDAHSKKIMDDIWRNSDELSFACFLKEHGKCKEICECPCHLPAFSVA
jgi:hypothetical protein